MIGVLRLGHRIGRDERTTTHVCLVARAFGAEYMAVCGDRDEGVIESVARLQAKWGRRMQVEWRDDWRRVVKEWRERGAKIAHLTMYGLPLDEGIERLRGGDVLVVVGGEKVPGEVYGAVGFNISVTGQPHSEVAALAVFLDRYFRGEEMGLEFGGSVKIKPSNGRKIVKTCK